jgi:hypothetical protein
MVLVDGMIVCGWVCELLAFGERECRWLYVCECAMGV